MKKILCFFVFAVLLSCSGDDSSSTNSNTETLSFHPPAWIKGQWILDTDLVQVGYKFTDDDFCNIQLPQATCYKNMINQSGLAGGASEIEETIISDTEYKFSFSYINFNYTYHFRKVNATTISMAVNGTPTNFHKL